MKSEKLRKLISKIPHKFQIVLILYEGVWNKDAKKCEKDIEATAKMLKKQIAEAKTELEKEAKNIAKIKNQKFYPNLRYNLKLLMC
jgi:hypothetical protein